VTAYEVILHERAWAALNAAKAAEKNRLLALLDEMRAAPFRSGDLQQIDETGRVYEVVLSGDWLVSFWSDHAVREIRVVNLQKVED
jgi:hypothetical protein